MTKLLAKLWLWIVGISLIIANGWACYHEHQVLWAELVMLGVIVAVTLTVVSICELTDNKTADWHD